MDEELYGDWDEEDVAEGDDEDELEFLIAQLDVLVTEDEVFDDLVDAALDWFEELGPLSVVASKFERLDKSLATCLPPESQESLQRQLMLLRRSIAEEDVELMCLALIQLGQEIPDLRRPEPADFLPPS